jgi:hypothetical protein
MNNIPSNIPLMMDTHNESSSINHQLIMRVVNYDDITIIISLIIITGWWFQPL